LTFAVTAVTAVETHIIRIIITNLLR
jgi:hypothetical protein